MTQKLVCSGFRFEGPTTAEKAWPKKCEVTGHLVSTGSREQAGSVAWLSDLKVLPQ